MPRHWDPGKLIVNEQTFSIKLPKSWIPVSRTGMTSFIMQHRVTLQCSYSCGMNCGMTVK
nr:WPE palindromic element domain-containing protein [Wolbachia endosymbiont (group A) of Trypoxylon clavicerum]